MSKLRESARHAPHCFYCFLENPNGDLLCLAHSNELSKGRGAYHKSPDEHGAIVCNTCHSFIDGQAGGFNKAAKREMHRVAAERTKVWWVERGYLVGITDNAKDK